MVGLIVSSELFTPQLSLVLTVPMHGRMGQAELT